MVDYTKLNYSKNGSVKNPNTKLELPILLQTNSLFLNKLFSSLYFEIEDKHLGNTQLRALPMLVESYLFENQIDLQKHSKSDLLDIITAWSGVFLRESLLGYDELIKSKKLKNLFELDHYTEQLLEEHQEKWNALTDSDANRKVEKIHD